MSEKNEKEINSIKEDFDSFKENNSKKMQILYNRIDDIFIQLAKPLFTIYQSIGLISLFLVYAIGVVLYTEGTKSDVRVNTVEIKNVKEDKALLKLQNTTILKALNEIQKDVAVLKSKIK